MSIVISEHGGGSNPYIDKIRLVRGNIEDQDVDAVVTVLPANIDYRGEINAALLEKAGMQLDRFLQKEIHNPRPGDVYAVPGFNLPCKHIFFSIVPVWRGDFERHNRFLVNACRKAMETARSMRLQSLAVPAVASGRNGYPKQRAARLIVQGLTDRLYGGLEELRIVTRSAKVENLFRDQLYGRGWLDSH